MELGWRWLCVAAITLTFFTRTGRCLGASCHACDFKEPDETACKRNGHQYLPEVAITDEFCAVLRESPVLVAELCQTYPNGYKIWCSRRTEPREVRCSRELCPAEPAQQTGDGSAAVSQHSLNFLFITTVTLLSLSLL